MLLRQRSELEVELRLATCRAMQRCRRRNWEMQERVVLGKNSGNVNRIPKAIAGCCPAVAHRPDKPAANSYRMLTCGCTCMKRALAVVAFEDNCTLRDGNIRKRLELQLMLRLQKSNIDGKRMPTLDSHDECRIGSSRTVAPCKSLRSHGQVHQGSSMSNTCWHTVRLTATTIKATHKDGGHQRER